MQRSQALECLIPPGRRRHGKMLGGVLQVWVTRACDLACPSCTQGSNLRGKAEWMSLEHFERACASLRDYWGVVGVFGGNPALHPQFAALCRIMRRYITYPQRGIWCNHPRGHGHAMRLTFCPSVSNLNVHLRRDAYDEFRRAWPECRPVGLTGDSRHSPPLVALQDVEPDEGRRWRLISQCDINRHWSAMICVVRGQLRGYFCEIAGAHAMLHQHDPAWPDTGLPIEAGWWRRPMADFAPQADWHCHRCGVPLRLHGPLSQDPTAAELTSHVHASVARPRGQRPVRLVTHPLPPDLQRVARMTDYLGNAQRKDPPCPQPTPTP